MSDNGGGADRTRVNRLFVIFMVALTLILVFPIYGVANRVEPYVLGMPFSLAWIVFWTLVEFIVLILFFRWEYSSGRGDD